MSETSLAGAWADRAAIERWEGEGGRSVEWEEPSRHQVDAVRSLEQIENVVLGGGEGGKNMVGELAE